MRSGNLAAKILVWLAAGFLLCALPVKATDLDLNGVPASGTLSGAAAGNQLLLTANFDLSQLPAAAVISKASLSFDLGPAAQNDGSVAIFDMYNYGSNGNLNPLQIYFLNSIGTKTADITPTVAAWILHPERDLGLVFKAVNLADTVQMQLINIKLNISYDIPVADPILLLSGPETAKLNTNIYRITTTVNKPVTALLQYGKTINYGTDIPITIPATTIVYDLNTLQSGISYHFHLILTDNTSSKLTTPDLVFIPQLTTGGSVTPSPGADLKLDLSLLPPAQIQALVQTSGTAPQVQLNWPAAVSGSISGYLISRREAGTANFSEIARVTANTFVYVDTDVLPGQSYEYQIRDYTALSESPGSVSGIVFIPVAAISQNGTAAGNNTGQSLVWAFVFIASAALVIYGIIKLVQRGKSWLNPKPKKRELKNVFRDPDLVE